MTADLPDFWTSFEVDVDAEVARVSAFVTQAFIDIIQIATSIGATMSRADETGSAMRTFAANLRHRERLISYGVKQVTDDFETKLSALRADTLSFVRTSFIGRLVENTYHAANMEHGM